MRKDFLIFLLIFQVYIVYSQIDKGKSIELEGLTFTIDSTQQDVEIENPFNVKIPQNLSFSPDFNPNFNPNKTDFDFLKSDRPKNNPSDFLTKTDPSRKDVLKIQYYNGKDVSNPQMKTNQALGQLSTTSEKIRIECRDHSYVDGDRVRVYLNEKILYKNIALVGSYFVINIDLNEGFNRIDIEALNQGSSGPNTAEFLVFDKKGMKIADKEWNMGTGQIATLVVIKN